MQRRCSAPPLLCCDDVIQPSREELVHALVSHTGSQDFVLPPGIEKVAARRDDKDLPEPTTRTIWRHPAAHPLILILLVLDRYGPESMEWEPEVLSETLRRDDIHLSNSVWTKVLAARVLFNSPSPWRRWEAFHWVSCGLNGVAPNMVFLEMPEPGYQAVAADIMGIVDSRQTGEEVDKYVAATFIDAGIPYAPYPLDFAQLEMDRRRILCMNCGADDRDDNDVRCVTCGSTDLVRKDPFAELREAVKKRWDERYGLPLEQAVQGLRDDTPVDIATEKLLIRWDYRDQVRYALRQQLHILARDT